MKPTYGTVSRNGLIAYGSSLDQIGPLCRDVADCAALLEAISGKDRMDSTSMERRTDFTAALTEGVKGLRIGIPKDYFSEGLDEEVKKAVLQAAQKLAQLGAQVEEFDLSLTEYAVPAYYTIASAEASSNLERFDGVKYGYRTPEYEGLHDMYKRDRSEGFGTEVKRRIMLGSFVLSSGYYDAYYLKALRVKAMIRKAFDEAFSRFDCILGPVAPAPAPLLGGEPEGSDPDVPGRYLHHFRKSGGDPRHQPSLRPYRGWPAHRSSAHGGLFSGEKAAPGGVRIRTGERKLSPLPGITGGDRI